jgi:hypothetical protein
VFEHRDRFVEAVLIAQRVGERDEPRNVVPVASDASLECRDRLVGASSKCVQLGSADDHGRCVARARRRFIEHRRCLVECAHLRQQCAEVVARFPLVRGERKHHSVRVNRPPQVSHDAQHPREPSPSIHVVRGSGQSRAESADRLVEPALDGARLAEYPIPSGWRWSCSMEGNGRFDEMGGARGILEDERHVGKGSEHLGVAQSGCAGLSHR